MNALLGLLFPVLSGRVEAALLIRSQRAQLDRMARENARLRSKNEAFERYRRDAHARLTAGLSSSPTRAAVEEATRAH